MFKLLISGVHTEIIGSLFLSSRELKHSGQYWQLFIVITAGTVKAVGIKMNDNLPRNTTPSVEQENYEKDLPKGDKASHNSDVRKRIDDLLEQKRLKALLDDADDWDF